MAEQVSKYPWESSSSTREVLLQLIGNGDETEKVEFKLDIDLQGAKQEKNELLLDLACIANSYSSDYDNHGFLILGVHPETKEIVGTSLTKESLTTHLDERMAKFLAPHVKFSVELFDTDDGTKKWGAIITRPSIELPHIFVRDTETFNIGEVWVRKGSHKARADAGDYGRFFAIRTESLKKDIDQLQARMNLQENDLKKRIETLEKKQKAITKSPKSVPIQEKTRKKKDEVAVDESDETASELPITPEGTFDEHDLLNLVKRELPKQSPLKAELLSEIQKGLVFLESDEIPWNLRIGEANKQDALDTIQGIQSRFESFYKALFELTFFGDKKEHSEMALLAVQKLARYMHKGGVPYDALYVRYLPLITVLYIVSMAAVYRKDSSLLTKVIDLDLSNKDRYANKYSITDALFFVRSATEVFDALHPSYPSSRWCDGVGTYLKQYFSSFLANYEEIQDPEALFYEGEFLLTLTPVIAESESGLVRGHISSGGYIFYSEASGILENFIRNNKELLQSIFGTQLKAVLENFEEYAPKMGSRGGCWADGVPRGATKILFPEAKIIETED